MDSPGGVDTKQKTLKHLNTLATSPPPRKGSSVTSASPSQPAEDKCGEHQQGPGAATRVGAEKPGLVQNTVSTNQLTGSGPCPLTTLETVKTVNKSLQL